MHYQSYPILSSIHTLMTGTYLQATQLMENGLSTSQIRQVFNTLWSGTASWPFAAISFLYIKYFPCHKASMSHRHTDEGLFIIFFKSLILLSHVIKYWTWPQERSATAAVLASPQCVTHKIVRWTPSPRRSPQPRSFIMPNEPDG